MKQFYMGMDPSAPHSDIGAVTIYERIGEHFKVVSSSIVRLGDSTIALGQALERARKIVGPTFNRFYFNTAQRPFNRKKYLKRRRRIQRVLKAWPIHQEEPTKVWHQEFTGRFTND